MANVLLKAVHPHVFQFLFFCVRPFPSSSTVGFIIKMGGSAFVVIRSVSYAMPHQCSFTTWESFCRSGDHDSDDSLSGQLISWLSPVVRVIDSTPAGDLAPNPATCASCGISSPGRDLEASLSPWASLSLRAGLGSHFLGQVPRNRTRQCPDSPTGTSAEDQSQEMSP